MESILILADYSSLFLVHADNELQVILMAVHSRRPSANVYGLQHLQLEFFFLELRNTTQINDD